MSLVQRNIEEPHEVAGEPHDRIFAAATGCHTIYIYICMFMRGLGFIMGFWLPQSLQQRTR